MSEEQIKACLYKTEIEHLCKAHLMSAERHDRYVKSAMDRNKPNEEKVARDAAQRHRNRIQELRQAGREPAMSKTPDESTLASATGSAARDLAHELAEQIAAAEDFSAYPTLSTEQTANVIEAFFKARGLVPPNGKLSHTAPTTT